VRPVDIVPNLLRPRLQKSLSFQEACSGPQLTRARFVPATRCKARRNGPFFRRTDTLQAEKKSSSRGGEGALGPYWSLPRAGHGNAMKARGREIPASIRAAGKRCAMDDAQFEMGAASPRQLPCPLKSPAFTVAPAFNSIPINVPLPVSTTRSTSSSLVTVILAPGITEPEASVMFPTMRPVAS
jgi:hypothetical protein